MSDKRTVDALVEALVEALNAALYELWLRNGHWDKEDAEMMRLDREIAMAKEALALAEGGE